MFGGKGNLKQHVVHFIKTCNNADIYNDTMVKQFVCSLKGVTFECYTQLGKLIVGINSSGNF